MKTIKVNKNILWAELFAEVLANSGVKYACISPGSRSTPLTYAFATNSKIKSFSIIDERSSGFFALGLAKASQTPVILICTSGTAAAEFYPAIIEAYQNKVPLIICTADRPPGLLNAGANQTINQQNLYKNHIRYFVTAGLPQVSVKGLKKISAIAKQAFIESALKNIGPVHINFPFKEPFEPGEHTDEIGEEELAIIKSNLKVEFRGNENAAFDEKLLLAVSEKLIKYSKGIIVSGLDNYSKEFFSAIKKLSKKIGYPIFADAASSMRFAFDHNSHILTNYDSYLRSNEFVKTHQPDIILQFGRNFSSKALSNFIASCKCEKILVNNFGEWKNPNEKKSIAAAVNPELFCKLTARLINKRVKKNRSTSWLKEFSFIENAASKIKNNIFRSADFSNEVRIVLEILDSIPEGSNLMVSNSLPIRDLDLAVPLGRKNIKLYHNRGASGIDGIISTALGIAEASKKKTYLLIGDLAFYYDLNSLLTAKKYKIPLKIILINNNGGGIFEVLPISSYKNVFKEYFVTSHDLDFKNFILVFGGKYHEIKSWESFRKLLTKSEKAFSVLEFKTSAEKSLSVRKKYYREVLKFYNSNIKLPL